MTKPKTKVTPHPFVADLTVPADPLDKTGRRVCSRCHLVGRAGDAHHAMPDPVPDVQSRAAGEGGEA